MLMTDSQRIARDDVNLHHQVQDSISMRGSAMCLAYPVGLLGALNASLIRLLPHPVNMTPLTALGLFSGARLPRPSYFAPCITILLLIVTDLLIGLRNEHEAWNTNHSFTGFGTWTVFTYSSILMDVYFAKSFLTYSIKPWRIVLAALFGTIQFFLITNFGTWALSNIYERNLSGLMESYRAGSQFIWWPMFGDQLYTIGLFTVHYALTRCIPAFANERVRDHSTDSGAELVSLIPSY